MICVTLGRGRHSALVEEWKAAAAAGAELVELRMDCLRREADLKRLLKERPTPLVVTFRRAADGGLWRGVEEKRQQLMREAIVMGVDYIDVEMDIATQIRRYGKTKRIVSYHNLKETPATLLDVAQQCDEMDADIVKVATTARSVGDAMRVLDAVKVAEVPTVGIAMGEVGFFTRVLGAKYGAPLTYSGFNPDRIFAPGMPMFQVLKHDYFQDQVNAETEVCAVIGDPIAHSLSPVIHNAAFRHLGLNKVMVPILVAADQLAPTLNDLGELGLKGFSVTIPHKIDIVALLQEADDSVKLTGACNTVVVREGKKVGYNTDTQAAIHSLEDALGGRVEDVASSPLREKHVLILGAGGVARAIAFGLAKRGAVVTITNRHEERANSLAADVGCKSVNWAQRASTLASIMINCTPVGLHPNVDDSPQPPSAFKTGMVAFDTVYHPENTMFLKLARERECVTVTGVDMFVRQAADQFKLYTGQDAPIDLMRETLKRKLAPYRA